MHSHCRKSLCGIVSSHRCVIPSHHRKIHSFSLAVPTFHRNVTCHPADGHTICGDCYSFRRDVTFFRRIMSVDHRMMHVHRHDKRVHSVIVRSPRGIGCTQCRKVSSPEQSGSYYPRIGRVIHRKLCITYRKVLIICGERMVKSRVAKAFRL
jgi:hypothetical protein